MEQKKVPFSTSLKNSSTLKDWIDHEKRVFEIVTAIRIIENDFQNSKSKNPVPWTDVIKFRFKCWAS